MDEALEIENNTRGINLPQKGYKNDLNGRIEILADNGMLTERDKLHNLKNRRNVLAHELEFAKWDELSSSVGLIESTLQGLGFVGDRPKLEYFGERSAIRESPDPNILVTWEFKCGIKENGQVALEHTWTTNILKNK